MSFLLDTDISSAYLKNDRTVIGKVMLHFALWNARFRQGVIFAMAASAHRRHGEPTVADWSSRW